MWCRFVHQADITFKKASVTSYRVPQIHIAKMENVLHSAPIAGMALFPAHVTPSDSNAVQLN
jgi:hypothetical protein